MFRGPSNGESIVRFVAVVVRSVTGLSAIALTATGCASTVSGQASAPVAMPGMSMPMSSSPAASTPVVTASATATAAGQDRTYFLEADPVQWNYAPLGFDGITGNAFSDAANVFVKSAKDRIGSTYTKCLYHGYTDATFATPKPRAASDAYMGLLGPTIHAEVGDTITVVFKNTCNFPASVHPHGVLYDKSSEGAPYADGTTSKGDDSVAPGATYTYHWGVPDRAGPGPMDGSSVLWMYHSHTEEISDVYSGLIGALIVTGRGLARADGTPKDVDSEVVTMFAVMNENKTHYIDAETAALPVHVNEADDAYNESNLMHSINGFVFGNGPVPKIALAKKARWYMLDIGTEVDLHTPHWHGNTVLANGMRTDMSSLLPGMMMSADMTPDNPGIWLFHCHVNDHIAAGMQMRYEVTS